MHGKVGSIVACLCCFFYGTPGVAQPDAPKPTATVVATTVGDAALILRVSADLHKECVGEARIWLVENGKGRWFAPGSSPFKTNVAGMGDHSESGPMLSPGTYTVSLICTCGPNQTPQSVPAGSFTIP